MTNITCRNKYCQYCEDGVCIAKNITLYYDALVDGNEYYCDMSDNNCGGDARTPQH